MSLGQRDAKKSLKRCRIIARKSLGRRQNVVKASFGHRWEVARMSLSKCQNNAGVTEETHERAATMQI